MFTHSGTEDIARFNRDMKFILKKRKKDNMERNWSFTTSSPHMIAMEEITKYLTRDNPVIFFRVKTERAGKALHAFIHHTLIKKASYVNLPCPFEFTQYTSTVMFGSNLTIQESEIVKWAKEVKNKSWGDSGVTTRVDVGIPKI